MPFVPRKPDYKIKVQTPQKRSGEVGIGWLNQDGSVSIRLNPGVSLRWDDDLSIVAFPVGDDAVSPAYKRIKDSNGG